ncbi:hypothetical protein Skr01_56980 [Sphaerisporangium krabiense]|nr:hypothetical protein Skr01_56980 [Sphaerisporangium krabiense]
MSIYATLFSLDDDNHEPGQCAVWAPAVDALGGLQAITSDGRRWARVAAA